METTPHLASACEPMCLLSVAAQLKTSQTQSLLSEMAWTAEAIRQWVKRENLSGLVAEHAEELAAALTATSSSAFSETRPDKFSRFTYPRICSAVQAI